MLNYLHISPINQTIILGNYEHIPGNRKAQSSQVWVLLRQMGYENVYCLQGGMNYWVETIIQPEAPAAGSPDSEIFKYNFRKSTGAYLTGGLTVDSQKKETAAKPKFKPKKKKKKKGARGGCS